MSASQSAHAQLEIFIGPGATFPNWSAVTSDAARQALTTILEAFDVEKRWAGIGKAENTIRRVVLERYAELGHAPSAEQLVDATGIPRDEVNRLLRQLERRDLITLDDIGQKITGAYPFRDRETGHRVRLGDRVLNAMCAIDALGTGAMYGEDVTIDSVCTACNSAIHVTTCERGNSLGSVAPKGTVVWSGIQDTGGCAADTLCTVLAFFCSDDHLASWRRTQQADAPGLRLSVEEGLQVGIAIFSPLLAPRSNPNIQTMKDITS